MCWGKNGTFSGLNSTSIKRNPCDLLFNQRAMFSWIFRLASFRKSVVFQALSIVYSYVEQQTRAKKTDALAGDSMCTATLLLAWELQTYIISSPQNDILTDRWTDWRNSTRRIHIEEKIRENFLSFCLWSQWFTTSCCFDYIRNDKCPNESRRIMSFVATLPFWFLAGKYALENSSIVCRAPL